MKRKILKKILTHLFVLCEGLKCKVTEWSENEKQEQKSVFVLTGKLFLWQWKEMHIHRKYQQQQQQNWSRKEAKKPEMHRSDGGREIERTARRTSRSWECSGLFG